VPKETYLEAFSAGNQWCDYSTKTFIPDEGFITNIFGLLNASDQNKVIHGVDVSKKVIKIIKKLLNHSKFSKALMNCSTI
jgi:hypothetical protein